MQYKVLEKGGEDEKYETLRDLIESKNCPTIVYVSRTKKAYQLAERLTRDGFSAKPYYGKMETKEKISNQNAFVSGEISIMVATSAFGMGVDKKDVGLVIHYEISDSLENYIQEAGRAGRDENIVADCFVLFKEEDLDEHFSLLSQTKLSIKEIQQVWRAIKEITRFRSTISNSALEIARKAGWDDNVVEIETRVTTAIAALEDAGYLKRGQNMPRVFANSILSKNTDEARDKILISKKLDEGQKENAIRIIAKLLSSKSRKQVNEELAESRVDYISDHLGIKREEVINIIHLLREEKILADAKDLTVFIRKGENKNRSIDIVETFCKIEKYLLPVFEERERTYHIKELNEEVEIKGCEDVTSNKIKTIINFWVIKNWIKRQRLEYSSNHIVALSLHPREILENKLSKRQELAKFIIERLFWKSSSNIDKNELNKEEVKVEFSVNELKEAYENSSNLFKSNITVDDVEDALFYLSRIEAIKIEGGFLVVYNRLTIERLEHDNKKQYKTEDYQKLNQFYDNKIQQIHIVGEYAKKMIDDYMQALQFVEDYFQLNYSTFLNKYFKDSRQSEIKRNLTPAKFKQLFGELSPTQLKIIKDNENKNIVVAAGPGSGKTRLLVHKLASLLLLEDIKREQLLMLTFSRAAVTEFKKRLLKLIGDAGWHVAIKTFHSYCFDLLGKVGTLEKSKDVLRKAIEKIRNKEVEMNGITRTVLVIDEAQDMDEDEFDLVNALMEQNEGMRVIAVGDDDQNIYAFRGASSKYLEQFILLNNAKKYELVENYRSKANLVDFTNQFVCQINDRLKTNPIVAKLSDLGKITLVRHEGNHLISPLVQNILSVELVGTTCVLTKTNEEASQIAGLLLKNGVSAKLIQSNDDFNLYNLSEIRFFLHQLDLSDDVFIIDDSHWAKAKRALIDKFHNSNKLDLCINIINDFEITNPKKKYKSDLEVFIRESRPEDFFNENGETIFVSTIHKAKGKEFDNVFIMLQNFYPATDDAKRQLYVAMTRAKQQLTIHLNTTFLDYISTENLELIVDKRKYPAPDELIIQLSHKDVILDYFIGRQDFISRMVSGDTLILKGDKCLTLAGKSILKFSKQFLQEIERLKKMNYELKSANVNFIVFWQKKDFDGEIKIILPELYFEKIRPGFLV